VAAALGVVLLIALAFRCSSDTGVTFDEVLQKNYGKRILYWYTSGFSDRSALTYAAPLYEYGGAFEAPAHVLIWLLPFDWVATHHALTALCAVLGVVATWRIATRLAGSRAGFFAAATLALTPAFFGHGLFNSKDIPFATAATWALDATLSLALSASPAAWRTVWMGAAATGVALGIRAGGMFMLLYPALAVLGRSAVERATNVTQVTNAANTSPTLMPTGWPNLQRLVAGSTLSWLIMLGAWPWAQLSPFVRPFQAVRLASQFSWNGTMLFDGMCVHAQHLARRYLPVWFAVTLPELYLLGAMCFPPLIWIWLRDSEQKRRLLRLLALAVLGVAAIVPLLAAVIGRVVVYDGQRHFLFVLPPLAAVCGCAIAEVTRYASFPRVLRHGVVAVFFGLAMVTARDMISLHPYEYIYFNRLAGGLPSASKRFETDYWGASYREGLSWLVQHVKPAVGTKLRVASCSCFDETKHYLNVIAQASDRFEAVIDRNTADIFLATTRDQCQRTEGDVMHVVSRQGVPLLYVIRRPARLASERTVRAPR
jgi:4-amino-4-deoxy-L-arabinose transferase-like glycosyltransferase